MVENVTQLNFDSFPLSAPHYSFKTHEGEKNRKFQITFFLYCHKVAFGHVLLLVHTNIKETAFVSASVNG